MSAVASMAWSPGLLLVVGMRRSEVSTLHWADIDAADVDMVLVTVRRGKTNQEGETKGVRFVRGGVARAIWTLSGRGEPGADEPRRVLAEDGGGSGSRPRRGPPASSG